MRDKLIQIELGARFGQWVVLGFAGRKGHSSFWKCTCDCGEVAEVNGYSLRKGTTKQCLSCKINKLHAPENRLKSKQTYLSKRPQGTSAFNKVLCTYKQNARIKNRVFQLTESEFKTLLSGNCHYCGKPPSSISRPWNDAMGILIYNGVDRKDNTVGYVLGNCVTCCAICNHTKRDMLYEDFRAWVKMVFNHFGNK